MSLSFQVLGNAGRDNALLVTVDSGQAINRLLFDCGDGCLNDLPFAVVQTIDHLLFSHLHMDHIGGFDTFFRCTYNRTARLNHVWGPPGTGEIVHHRFQGFLWNLVADQQATWEVHDLHPNQVSTHRYELAEAFRETHDVTPTPYDQRFLSGPGFTVEALLMDHGTPSVAYIVRETPRVNIETSRLAQLGLRPGPWLQRVRGPQAAEGETVTVDGGTRDLRELQDALLTVTAGESVAYLTDFLLDQEAMERLREALQGVTTVVCECQYRNADQELARKNYHMTTLQVATLAKRAAVGRLVLFHLSDRYQPEEWQAMLGEAQAIFGAATFPGHWQLPS
jgi:ribonuclease Z